VAMASAPACKWLSVCNDFTGDPPTRPTVIFQWVGVSLILAQKEEHVIKAFLKDLLSDF
jgi:hypothetical protein